MGINVIPSKRFVDMYESVTYKSMDALSLPTAIVEPETVGTDELVDADVQTALAAIDTAFTGTFSKTGDQTINAGTSAVFASQVITCPTDATEDSIVVISQQLTYVYVTGYVSLVSTGVGTVAEITIVGHNIGGTNETISNATTFFYAVHDGAAAVQPKTPNTQLVVTSSNRWLDGNGDPTNAPITVAACNKTAQPVFAITDNSITEIELKSDDMARLASQYTGNRMTFTTGSTIPVPTGAQVFIGDAIFALGISARVVIVGGNGSARPIFTGFVSMSNGITIVSVYARNDFSTTSSVPGGTLIKVFVY
jgi:hypothetical protein